MEFTKLAESQRRQFETEGYLILRGALDRQTIARLIEAGDRLIAGESLINRQREHEGLYDGFRNCITMDDAFLPLLTHPRTLPLIIQLLGPNIHLVTSHLIYKHPDPADTPPTVRRPSWHRDIAGSPEDLGHANLPRMEMKCAFYLTDLTQPNSGATLFSPGSNQLKQGLHIPPGKADPDNVLEPLLEPGDAVLFENRTFHATAANLKSWTRKVVMLGYGYRWLKPFDYKQHSPELIAKVDEIGAQLLGAVHNADGQFAYYASRDVLRDWCQKNGVVYRPPQSQAALA